MSSSAFSSHKTPRGWLLSAMHNGHLVQRLFIYYTKAQARKLFREHLNSIK